MIFYEMKSFVEIAILQAVDVDENQKTLRSSLVLWCLYLMCGHAVFFSYRRDLRVLTPRSKKKRYSFVNAATDVVVVPKQNTPRRNQTSRKHMSSDAVEQSKWDTCVDCMCSAIAKFCSLVVATSMFLGEIVYMVGVAKLVSTWGGVERIIGAHVVGMAVSLLALIGYLYLFFRGQKQQQFMSFLTILLIVSFTLIAHSVGIAAPSVIDCDNNFTLIDSFGEVTGNVINGFSNVTLNRTFIKYPVNSYEGSLLGCHDQSIVLGGAIVVGFFQLVAIFDVQRVLLRRVRAKTYGDRFSEMGIK